MLFGLSLEKMTFKGLVFLMNMTAERIMIAKKKIVIDAIAADFTELAVTIGCKVEV